MIYPGFVEKVIGVNESVIGVTGVMFTYKMRKKVQKIIDKVI